jgi:hypothetical protein
VIKRLQKVINATLGFVGSLLALFLGSSAPDTPTEIHMRLDVADEIALRFAPSSEIALTFGET